MIVCFIERYCYKYLLEILKLQLTVDERDVRMSYEDLTLNGFVNEVKEVSTGPHPRKFSSYRRNGYWKVL